MGNTSCQSSSLSTGGSGNLFEINTQTLFAILMLTHGRVPGYSNSEIKEIHQQTNVTGHHVDDFMVVLNDLTTNRQHYISFQAKRSITIGNNTLFKSVIDAAYKDFCSPDFKMDRDRLVLLCGAVSSKKVEAFHFVHDFSKKQPDANTFFTKLFAANFASKEVREIVSLIQNHLQTIANGISQDTVFNFLKCFCVWTVDLHHDDSFVRALLNSHVAVAVNSSVSSPKSIWSMVFNEMAERNQYAGVTNANNLPDEIKQAFIAKKPEEMPNKFSAKKKKTKSQKTASESLPIEKSLLKRIKRHNLFRDFFYALMIGGWNERSRKDIIFIKSIISNDYDSWKWNIKQLHHDFQEIIVFKNDEWKFLYRKELLTFFREDLNSSDLRPFNEQAIRALIDNSEFELSSQTCFYQGQRINDNYSTLLRDNISETLAILGNMTPLSSYSYHLPKTIAQTIVRQVLANHDFRIWESLNRNMGNLAEADPSGFFEAVETKFCKKQSILQKLYNEERTDNLCANNTSGIISALERLIWVDSYFSRAAEIMIRLDGKPCDNGESSALNALTSVLIPWHPQTFASSEARKMIVKKFFEIVPDSAWRLLLSLLPKTYSTTMQTARPQYLNTTHDNFDIPVTKKEYWDISEYYISLALDHAGNDISRLLSLVGLINTFPPHLQKRFLDLVSDNTVLNLPDKDRFQLWDKLLRLCSTHRSFSFAEWALPETTLKRIDKVVEKLKPRELTLEFLPLFSQNSSDLLPHEPRDRDSYFKNENRIEKLQQNAVGSLLKNNNINALIQFSKQVDRPFRLGWVSASICSKLQTQQILDQYLADGDFKVQSFLSSFIPQKYNLIGQDWPNTISRNKWTIEQTVAFLCSLRPISNHTLQIMNNWLKKKSTLYWLNLDSLNAAEVDVNVFYSVIDGFLHVGRPAKAIELLGQRNYDAEISFDATRAQRALLTKGKQKDKTNKMTGYYLLKVIELIQDSPELSDEDKRQIEWKYVDILCHPGNEQSFTPKYLYKDLSSNPDSFCKIISLTYKSTKDTNSSNATTQTEELNKMATNSFNLLWNWKLHFESFFKNDSFCFDSFREWFDQVVAKTTESGHLEVALDTIGESLFYSPPETDGSLFINKGIADLLDREEYKQLRIGYRCGCFNSRGAYCVDPTAAPELKYAEEYRNKAKAVNDIGFPRFAELLRSIAERYEDDARRIRGDHGTDDSP